MKFEVVDNPEFPPTGNGRWQSLIEALLTLEDGKSLKCEMDSQERRSAYQSVNFALARLKPGYRATTRTADGQTYISLRKRDEAR